MPIGPTATADLLVIGGGIVGLAHACLAARAGLRVVLLERSLAARGASVRNFGMIWPIGQPFGERRELALRSRALWDEFAALAGFRCEPTGSLHVARHEDEWTVLRQFAAMAGDAARMELLDAAAATAASPRLRRDGLRGALWSPDECNVDAPAAVAALHRWLAAQPDAGVHLGAAVIRVGDGGAETADGRRFEALRTVVCGGDDFATLFPERFAAAPLRRCRLQMLRSAPQPDGFRLGPMLAGGLTLLHYTGFRGCPGLAAVRARYEVTHPEHLRCGIHVMVAQRDDGSLVIGDSHEYGREFAPETDAGVERRILDYLGGFFHAPDPGVAARWTGTYAKRTNGELAYVERVRDDVTIVTGLGGAGMTLSFGLAERVLGLAPGGLLFDGT